MTEPVPLEETPADADPTGAATTPGITIDSMTRKDIATVLPYEEQLFGSEQWSAESYRDELADRRHRTYLVARDDAGALVGWGGVLVVGATAQILTLGTVPAAQGRGVGQALLSVLLQRARAAGAEETLLEVRVDNAAAIRLYQRNGFTDLRIRRGYYELGRVDAREMRRAL